MHSQTLVNKKTLSMYGIVDQLLNIFGLGTITDTAYVNYKLLFANQWVAAAVCESHVTLLSQIHV